MKADWTSCRAHQYKPSDPARNSADWNDAELADLARGYLRGISVEDLAIIHKRKRNAIECRLGRIANKLALN